MDLADSIKDFFKMLESYIELLIGYLEDSQIMDLLQYLFICIPLEVRGIIILIVLLLLVLGLKGVIKH